MKFLFSPYELKINSKYQGVFENQTRHGALLKIETKKGIGYADCHPWTEFGDVPLQKQLEMLSQDQFTPLTRQSLYFAEIDAEARERKINLLTDLPKLESHALLSGPHELTSEYLMGLHFLGYRHAKLKIRGNLKEIQERLNQLSQIEFWIRLDANGRTKESEITEFWKGLTPQARSMIEFIEDPCLFTAKSWTALKAIGVRIASDFEGQLEAKQPYDVVILKPAVQQCSPIHSRLKNEPLRFVFTSYLDHPLGQVSALWTAASLIASEARGIATGGFLSHLVYETTDFSERLMGKAPYLKLPTGSGFGFDDLLSGQTWQPISSSK